ncbi:MAG: 30S ribosomal protein S1 [Verrucomicrobiota bacterium]
MNDGRNSLKLDLTPGEKVKGTVCLIDSKMAFLDFGGRSEGMIDREELLDEEGNLTVAEGDTLEAFYAGGDEDGIRLTTKLQGKADDSSLRNAYEGGLPVEGKVTEEVSGGFAVDVSGFRGFCPYSQIALSRQEPAAVIGEKFLFNIIEYEGNGRNIVLSRRQLLEKERERQREELKERLQAGDVVDGTVINIKDFGAFVDIGGIEGLIPVSELAWKRTEKTEDVVATGDSVRVLIKEVDWENERISLSLRQAQGDPWLKIGDRYAVGQTMKGTVTKLMQFGAFIELEPGVDGLLHISKMGQGKYIKHPKEVVTEGDELEVVVESIDTEERRIGLKLPGSGESADGDDETRQDVEEYSNNKAGDSGLGSVGDVFDSLGL